MERAQLLEFVLVIEGTKRRAVDVFRNAPVAAKMDPASLRKLVVVRMDMSPQLQQQLAFVLHTAKNLV